MYLDHLNENFCRIIIILSSCMIVFFLICSMVFNLFLVIPLFVKYWGRFKQRFFGNSIIIIDEQDLIDKIVSTTLNNKKPLMTFFESTGLPSDYLQWISPRGAKIHNNFQTSYMLFGLLSYGIATNRIDIIDYVDSRIEMDIDENGTLSYSLSRLDQVPIGMSMILIGQYKNSQKYNVAINQLLEYIIDKYRTDGRVLYLSHSETQHVDAIGMFIPFLSLLSNVDHNDIIKEIINRTIDDYFQYGVDNNTHIPSHGFNIKTKCKIGSSNWGRGIGWFLLGLSFVEDFSDSILNDSITKLDYTQFPGQDSHFDSSTALMIEIYKHRKNLPFKRSWEFIIPYITREGNVGSCSGDTYSYNRYSNTFSPSELCNGLFLYLVTLRLCE